MQHSNPNIVQNATFWQNRIVRYAAAVIFMGIAFALLQLFPVLFAETPFLLLWGAVALTAAFSGFWPGVISALLAVFGVYALEPSLMNGGLAAALIRCAIFLGLALLVNHAFERYRRTRQSAVLTEQYLETMVRSAKDFGILTMNLDGIITTWSEGATVLFGFGEDEVIGKHFEMIFTPDDKAQGIPQHELDSAISEGSAMCDRWAVRKDKSRMFISGVNRPMFDSSGRLIGFIKVARDDTPARIMEQERAELFAREHEARQELQRANDTIMRFVAVISHEVRTPLTSIKGLVSTMLATDVEWSEDQRREFLTVVEQEADRLTDLTSHLLDYSRLSLGKLRVTPKSTSVAEVVEAVQPQIQQLGARHNFVIDIPATLPEVMADPDRIGQVLMNLFSNAVRYTPYGTKITISAQVQDGFLQVNMSDEGPGIPPDKRNQIFGSFEQLGIDRRGETEGAGLGLSIAKGLVEAHGGRIWIADGTLPGTTISFTLPIGENGLKGGANNNP